MKLSTVIAVGAIACGSLILASPTIASTIVRTTSWIMNQEREMCIKEAIKVANQSGFSERHEVVESDLNLPISAFYAFSKTGPYAMSVECNEDRGTSSLAVSGIMHKQTNKRFDNVIDAWQKLYQ